MKPKQFLIALLIVFVVHFGLEFLIHGVLLKPTYDQTRELWRPEQEQMTHFPAMLAGQFLVVLAFLVIWAKGFAEKGTLKCGAMYGLFMGLFAGGGQLIMHAVQPLPLGLVLTWIAIGCAEAALLGMIAAKLMKPRTASQS